MGQDHSLYDDFPWLHSQIRGFIHDTAAFLSWHRYFIHVYESALRDQCGYTGHLTYWNWGLDWEDITKSPVWDTETGFGGNGHGEIAVGDGRCLTDGPFANFQALYFGAKNQTHCLSRGFRSGADLDVECGQKIRPDALEKVLRLPDYDALNIGIEHGPHDAIPHGVRGDFIKVTAPYDPVFFLHHTQLDRLWWTWQQEDPEKRLTEYIGKARGTSSDKATLDDMLKMYGFAPDVKVSEVMKTDTELLCYRY